MNFPPILYHFLHFSIRSALLIPHMINSIDCKAERDDDLIKLFFEDILEFTSIYK